MRKIRKSLKFKLILWAFSLDSYLISGLPLRNCVIDKSVPLTVMLSIVLYSWHLEAIRMAFLITKCG